MNHDLKPTTMNTINNVDIALQIVTMPRRFHSLGNISMFSLLEETGYFELHDQVSESDIRIALLRDSECVQEWMQYCSDKRTSSGWYIRLIDEELYEVGYFDIKADHDTNRLQYENAIDACAAFIKHEIEDMRLYRLQEQRRRQQQRQRQQQQAKERKQRRL